MSIKYLLKQHRPFIFILLLHLILSTTYASLIPLGEAPDEAAHLTYARFIAKNKRLSATLAERDVAGYRSTWPPLYHFLIAIPVAIVGDTSPTRLKSVGDTPRRLIPTNGQTIAAFIHTADEAWPWQGISLVWHLGRFISVILTALAVCVTYIIAWKLTRQHLPAISAAALHAFLPQALFIGSIINDDNLLIFLSGLILLIIIHYTQQAARPGPAQFFLLGTILGLATVAKYNALPVWVIVIIWTLWQTYIYTPALLHRHTFMHLLRHTAPLLTGATLTGGWWFFFIWRNFNQIDTLGLFQGSFAALSAGTADASLRQLTASNAAITLPPLNAWLEWSILLFQSFWGLFGGGSTIELPGWIYWLLALICLIASASLIMFYVLNNKNFQSFGLTQNKTQYIQICKVRYPQMPIVATSKDAGSSKIGSTESSISQSFWLLIPFFYLPLPLLRFILSNRLVETAQGRHLFPALPFIALGLILGLSHIISVFLSRPSSSFILQLSSFILFILSLYSLTLILDSYPPPIPLHTTTKTNIENQLEANLIESITLIGYELGQPVDGLLPITLLWQANAIPTQDYLIDLTLTDPAEQIIGHWIGHPIGGRYPTRAWDPGDLLRDAILLPLLPNHPATKATLTLTLLDTSSHPTTNPFTLTANLTLPPSPSHRSVPALANTPYTYRNTLSFALLNQTTPPTLIAPTGQRFTPTHFIPGSTSSIAHFIIAPHWPSGNYQSSITNYQLLITNRLIQLTPPPIPHLLNANFADQITVLGYNLPQRRVEPGQSFPITLHLQARHTLGQDLVIFNHLLDQNAIQRGGADRIPQQYYTTLLWVPGEIVSDAYDVPVDADAPPGIYWLDLGLYPADNPTFSLPLFVNNQPIDRRSVTLGPIKVGGPPPEITNPQAQPHTPLNLSFANQITLFGFDLLDTNGNLSNPKSKIQNLKLYWQPTSPPPTDYTVFVHILDPHGNLVAQADSPPAAGTYPTSLWDPGEIIIDEHPLPNLPSGRYTVRIGLYRPDTGERLPVIGSPEGIVDLFEVEIE